MPLWLPLPCFLSAIRNTLTVESHQQTYYCLKINISHSDEISDPKARLWGLVTGEEEQGCVRLNEGLLLHLVIPAKVYETVSHVSFVLSEQTRKLSNLSQQSRLRTNPMLWMMTGMDYQGDIRVWGAGIPFIEETFKVMTHAVCKWVCVCVSLWGEFVYLKASSKWLHDSSCSVLFHACLHSCTDVYCSECVLKIDFILGNMTFHYKRDLNWS